MAKETASTEVEIPLFDLGEHDTFDGALAALVDTGAVVDASILGDGTNLVGKSDLVGKTLIITGVHFKPSDKGDGTYVVVRGMTMDGNKKFVFADGGTGVAAQLRDLFAKRPDTVGIYVERGLVESTYNHPQYGASTTFYLDTAGHNQAV